MAKNVQKIEVQWDDEDNFPLEGGEAASEENFGEMLSKFSSIKSSVQRPQKGERVEAYIVRLASSKDGDVFCALAGGYEALIPQVEMDVIHPGAEVGQKFFAYVMGKDKGPFVLGRELSQKTNDDSSLTTAYENAIPVKGKVTGVNKGGYDVEVLRRKAFCPFSGMDKVQIKDPQTMIGKEFSFQIMQMKGKDLVVSRRPILEAERKTKIDELKALAFEAPVLDGVVTEIRDYGVIVDIGGGITGMVHRTELAWGYVAKIKDLVQEGQSVRVKLLKVEDTEQGARISLSIKEAGEDPWDTLSTKIHVGGIYKIRVTRLEGFGAFAEILPGIEGLLPISEMVAEKRLNHAKELLAVGDELAVKILQIDEEKRRMSFTMKHQLEAEAEEARVDLKEYQEKNQPRNGAGFAAALADSIKR